MHLDEHIGNYVWAEFSPIALSSLYMEYVDGNGQMVEMEKRLQRHINLWIIHAVEHSVMYSVIVNSCM